MPRPSRRADIVKATLNVLARRGFAGLTTREIGRDAEVTSTSIYNHFPSLDLLVAEALRTRALELMEDYHLLYAMDVAPEIKLKTGMVMTMSGYQADPTMIHVYHHAYAEHREDAIVTMGEDFLSSFYPRLIEAIRAVAPDEDPRLLQYALSATSIGYAIYIPAQQRLWPLTPEELRPLALAESILGAVMPAVGWRTIDSFEVDAGRLRRPYALTKAAA